MAGEEGRVLLSSTDAQPLKVVITKRKAQETVATGCGEGDLKELKLQIEVRKATSSIIAETEDLQTLISPDASKTPSPIGKEPEESDTDTDCSEPEVIGEWYEEFWDNMLAELDLKESDVLSYEEIYAGN
jgi:hypothetical protein